MKKGTKVDWTLTTGQTGSGITITDEEDGHIQVAVHEEGSVQLEMHHVIFCATTWLHAVGSPTP